MNPFDVVVILFSLIAIVYGFRKGFLKQLALLVIIVLAAIFGGKLTEIILPYIINYTNISAKIAIVLSYIIVFIGIAVVVTLVERVIQKLITQINLSFINRVLGAVVCLFSTMFVLSILLNLTLLFDSEKSIITPEVRNSSFFFERVKGVVSLVDPYLHEEKLKEYIHQNYQTTTTNSSEINKNIVN